MDLGMSNTVTVSPTQLYVVMWVVGAYYLSKQIVWQTCINKGYAWLTNCYEVQDRNGVVQISGKDIFLWYVSVDSVIDSNFWGLGFKEQKI